MMIISQDGELGATDDIRPLHPGMDLERLDKETRRRKRITPLTGSVSPASVSADSGPSVTLRVS
jgi:hypothetical protein